MRQSPKNWRSAMTRGRTQANRNMAMHSGTHSNRISMSLGMALILVFGFQGLVFGSGHVAPLFAAETGTVSGHSLMKSDSHRGSGMEALVTIAAGEPRLKLEMKSDPVNVGKKPRRLIQKPAAGASQPESSQQADQGHSSSVPVAADQTIPATKDSAAGMAKSATGISPVVPPIFSGSSVATTLLGIPGSLASPGSSIGAAGSGGSSPSGGRSAQNLMRQLPGLQQLLTAQPGPRSLLSTKDRSVR